MSRTNPPVEHEIVAGFAEDGALRLSRTSYGPRHTAHGLSIMRTEANPIRTESIYHSDWTAEYTTGPLQEGAAFNSAMLVATGGVPGRDAMAERLVETTMFTYDLRLLGLTTRTPTTRLSKSQWRPIATELSIQEYFDRAGNVIVDGSSETELQFSMSIRSAKGTMNPASVVFKRIGDAFRLASLQLHSTGPQGSPRINRVTNSFAVDGVDVATTFPRTVVIDREKDGEVLSRTEFHIDREQWDVPFEEDHFSLNSLGIPDGVLLRVYGAPMPEFLSENAPSEWSADMDRKDFQIIQGVPKAFLPEEIRPLSAIAPKGLEQNTSNAKRWLFAANAVLFLLLGCYLFIRARRSHGRTENPPQNHQ